jgi:lysophospholipase L1-like esterase
VKNFSYSYRQVYYLEIPEGTSGKRYTGCIGHPNVQGQKRMAEAVYSGVKEILSQ